MGSQAEPQPEQKHVRWVEGPIIVGAGPSGLAAAACLADLGVPSTVLDKSDCIASLWQCRTYDRLRLHLPNRFCHLPLMPLPTALPDYPSKSHFLSYLHSYAARFSIRPRFRTKVRQAEFDRTAGLWRVRTVGEGDEEEEVLLSRWLVVATGENAEAVRPALRGMERFEGRVLHTCSYKSGADFPSQRVLVVGCGNSGMEVSLDLCRHNATPFLVVRNAVHVLPREMFGVSTFGIAMRLLKWIPIKVVDKLLLVLARLTLGDTGRLGLRRPTIGPMELKNLTGKTPVLDTGALAHIKSGGIKVMEGVKEITRTGARFVDGREEQLDSIVLATGYKSNVPSWLEGGDDLFSKEGMAEVPFPHGWKGENGLYCVGFTRRGLLGVASDALNVARDIVRQGRSNGSKDDEQEATSQLYNIHLAHNI